MLLYNSIKFKLAAGPLKSEIELPYEAVEQFSLLLEALDAAHSFAASAGIATSYFNAYDEWENSVDTLYR